jgi:membrane dipeptidase
MPNDAAAIHHRSLVADLHCDTVLYIKGGRDMARRNEQGHLDIPRLQEGGVDLQIFACFVPAQLPRSKVRPWTDELLDELHNMADSNQDRVSICLNSAQVRSTTEAGKIALVIGIENGYAIADDLENLEHYYRRGVRCMTLTHVKSHGWCSSSTDSNSPFDGLTEFGRRVVQRMNELGMIVDVSHVSEGAVRDVLDVTSKPIIASHSCVYSLVPHPRNLNDGQIRAIAENGGMVGINFCGDFLSTAWRRASSYFIARHPEEFRKVDEFMSGMQGRAEFGRKYEEVRPFLKAWAAELMKVPTDVGTVVDHIDYIVKLVGAAHVGLGSDYDGIFCPPVGLEDCSKLPNITEELVRRGYGQNEIESILGGNFMRVFGEVGGK